jgi:small-conductance mechanosensitive channel
MVIDRRKAARPHLIRAFVAGLVALAGLVATSFFQLNRNDNVFSTDDLVVLVATAVIAVAGVVAIRGLARAAQVSTGGVERNKTPLAFVISLMGYLLLLIVVVGALGFQLDKLLVGGAVTGVVLGIAAQQTIGNVFAGIVLLVVRPFSVGDVVYLKGSLGEYEGTITEMTLFYVHMATDRGEVLLPNAGVLASAVGPGARAEKQKEREEETVE